MKIFIKINLITFLCIFFVNVVLADFNPGTSLYGCFVENKGQFVDANGKTDNSLRYAMQSGNTSIYFDDANIYFVFKKNTFTESKLEAVERKQIEKTEVSMIKMSFIGSNDHSRITAEEQEPGYINYFLAHCPQGVTHVRSFRKLVFNDLYNNISLNIQPSGESLNLSLNLKPGANPEDVKYKISYSTGIQQNGELVKIQSGLGEVTQEFNNVLGCKLINGVMNFTVKDNKSIQSILERGDNLLAASIKWSSYYGGTRDDQVWKMKKDGSNRLVVIGMTQSNNWLPSVNSPIQPLLGGGTDAFVAKFDPDFGERDWLTYYGGSSDEEGFNLSVDRDGFITFVGSTQSSDFPVKNARQATFGGKTDGFITKVNPTGNVVEFSTFWGGSDEDVIQGVSNAFAKDVINPLYISVTVAGYTKSTNFPVGTDFPNNQPPFVTYQSTLKGNWDGFVSQFTKTGQVFFSTYFGGTNDDRFYDVANDELDRPVICGATMSNNFPTNIGNPSQPNHGGGADAVFVRFNLWGTPLVSSYFGGKGDEQARGIALSPEHEIVMCGHTNSTGQISTITGSTYAGGDDGFAARFSYDSTSQTLMLKWGRYVYFGTGQGNDYLEDIDVSLDDAAGPNKGVITAAGWSNSGGFGKYDAIYAAITSKGAIATNGITNYGGPDDDWGNAVTLKHDGTVLFLAGKTYSNNLPVTSGLYSYRDQGDGFIVAVSDWGSAQEIESNFMIHNISAHPNPVKNILSLNAEITEMSDISIEVTDLLGYRIFTANDYKVFGSFSKTIDMSSLAPGTYFLRIGKGGNYSSLPIIKM